MDGLSWTTLLRAFYKASTEEHGNLHLVRIGILIVSGIESNLYSIKSHQERLSLHFVELKFTLDLSADDYGVTEFDINAVLPP